MGQEQKGQSNLSHHRFFFLHLICKQLFQSEIHINEIQQEIRANQRKSTPHKVPGCVCCCWEEIAEWYPTPTLPTWGAHLKFPRWEAWDFLGPSPRQPRFVDGAQTKACEPACWSCLLMITCLHMITFTFLSTIDCSICSQYGALYRGMSSIYPLKEIT